MFLSGSSIFESKEFLKIVLLISLVIMVIAGIVVTYLHYRRKKKDSDEAFEESISGYSFALAGTVPVSSLRDITSIYIDGQTLEANGEKHAMLKNEFKEMVQQYAILGAAAEDKHDEEKTNELRRQMKKLEMDMARVQRGLDLMKTHLVNEEELMQAQKIIGERDQELQRIQHISAQQNKEIYLHEQQKQSHVAELSKLEHQLNEMRESARQATTNFRESDASYQDKLGEIDKQRFDEKVKWEDQLKNANEAYKKLEEENLALQDQLMYAHTAVTNHEEDDSRVKHLQNALKNAEDQVQELKVKFSGLGYLGDLVQEKKMQVDFLQNQLEQRVKAHHELEQQQWERSEQLRAIQEELSQHKQLTATLQQELQTEQQEIVMLQSDLQSQTHENQRRQDTFDAKVRHIAYLDEKMNELIQYNNTLQSAIRESNSQNESSEVKLSESHQRIQKLETTLEGKQYLLSKIYHELGSVVENEEKLTIGQQTWATYES